MIKWDVINNNTKSILGSYVLANKDNPPKQEDWWGKEYTLVNHQMDPDERREWAREKRQALIKDQMVDIVEATIFVQLGDPDFMNSWKVTVTDLLQRFPKDPPDEFDPGK